MKKLISGIAAALTVLSFSLAVSAASGYIVEPTANDNNSIVLEKGDRTLAALNFYADDDPDSFYFKVLTSLNQCLAAEAFDGQDAYYFDFVVNPSIPATSVPTLAIYNPYLDDDGEPVIKPEKVKIYQVYDDKLVDVTKNFSAQEDSDGKSCFVTATRKPGTYVLAEKSVDSEWIQTKEQAKKSVKKLPVIS